MRRCRSRATTTRAPRRLAASTAPRSPGEAEPPARPRRAVAVPGAESPALSSRRSGRREPQPPLRGRDDGGQRLDVVGALVAPPVDEEARRPGHLAGVRRRDVLGHAPALLAAL